MPFKLIYPFIVSVLFYLVEISVLRAIILFQIQKLYYSTIKLIAKILLNLINNPRTLWQLHLSLWVHDQLLRLQVGRNICDVCSGNNQSRGDDNVNFLLNLQGRQLKFILHLIYKVIRNN